MGGFRKVSGENWAYKGAAETRNVAADFIRHADNHFKEDLTIDILLDYFLILIIFGVSVEASILAIAALTSFSFWRLRFFGKAGSPLEKVSASCVSVGMVGFA